MSHLLQSPKAHVNKTLEFWVELDLKKSRHSSMGYRHPKWQLNGYADTCPYTFVLKAGISLGDSWQSKSVAYWVCQVGNGHLELWEILQKVERSIRGQRLGEKFTLTVYILRWHWTVLAMRVYLVFQNIKFKVKSEVYMMQ